MHWSTVCVCVQMKQQARNDRKHKKLVSTCRYVGKGEGLFGAIWPSCPFVSRVPQVERHVDYAVPSVMVISSSPCLWGGGAGSTGGTHCSQYREVVAHCAPFDKKISFFSGTGIKFSKSPRVCNGPFDCWEFLRFMVYVYGPIVGWKYFCTFCIDVIG